MSLRVDGVSLVLGDGDSRDPLQGFANSSTLISPGEHALVLDPGYPYDYYLPNGITLLTADDLSLGDGLATTDPIFLYLNGKHAVASMKIDGKLYQVRGY